MLVAMVSLHESTPPPPGTDDDGKNVTSQTGSTQSQEPQVADQGEAAGDTLEVETVVSVKSELKEIIKQHRENKDKATAVAEELFIILRKQDKKKNHQSYKIQKVR